MTYRWTDPAPRAVAAIRQRRHLRRIREWQPNEAFRNASNALNQYNPQFASNGPLPVGAFGCPV